MNVEEVIEEQQQPKYFFSAKENAFYANALRDVYENAGTWPDDAKEIEEEVYNIIQLELSDGKILNSDENGNPTTSEPPEISIEDLAASKRAEIDNAASSHLAILRDDYPDFEQISWSEQVEEAKAGGGPLTESISEARGLELEDLLERILTKHQRYAKAAGAVIGKRQALRDQIDDALTDNNREALDSVKWSDK